MHLNLQDRPRSSDPGAAGTSAARSTAARWQWAARLSLPLLLALLALTLQLVTSRLEARTAMLGPVAKTVSFSAVEPLLIAARHAGAEDGSGLPIGFSLEPGETLGGALGELGVAAEEIHGIGLAMAGVVSPRELRPGDGYAAYFADDLRLAAIEVTIEGRGRIQLHRRSDGWRPSWRPFERRIDSRQVQGTLEGALEPAIVAAGGEPAVAYRMADVLQWDVDFHRDLRRGDRFEVLYEGILLDGRFQAVGDILALRFRNGGTWLEAYRFGEDGGYYDFAGRALRKMFLRSPVPYSRVTSSFSNRRFHPVLKRYQPHYGVDFGAPIGTPVRVTGNGTVRSAGWNGGGGRTIKVGHANGYLTAYLHLSKFAKGIAPGVRVTQGQVIGYVGSTGLSTVPHLDYRVQQNGRWINPMSLKSEPADPVPVDSLKLFEEWRDQYRQALDTGEPWSAPERRDRPPVQSAVRSSSPSELGAPPAVGR